MLIYAILLSAIGMKSMYVLFGVYLGIFLLYLLISKGLPFIKKYFEKKNIQRKSIKMHKILNINVQYF